jgi:hypothetical protein
MPPERFEVERDLAVLGALIQSLGIDADTPVLVGVFDSDRNRYRAIRGESDSTRLATFHQLDLRIEKTWFFKLWRFSAYLDVQNIYNAKNAEAKVFWPAYDTCHEKLDATQRRVNRAILDYVNAD